MRADSSDGNLCEWCVRKSGFRGVSRSGGSGCLVYHYAVRYQVRFPPGTAYTEVRQRVGGLSTAGVEHS
jgi:hypothetical protein